MAPTRLHVVLPEPLRGHTGTFLQLLVNSLDGHATADLVRWAEPLMYCDHECPCQAVAADASFEPSNIHIAGTTTSGGVALSLVYAIAALLLIAIGVVVAKPSLGAYLHQSARLANDMPGSRVVGKVNIKRRQEGERLSLVQDQDDDEEDL